MPGRTPDKAHGYPRVLPVKATPKSTAQAILRASRHLDSPRKALAAISARSPRVNRPQSHATSRPNFGKEASNNLDRSAVDFDELFNGVASEIEELRQPRDAPRIFPTLQTDDYGTSSFLLPPSKWFFLPTCLTSGYQLQARPKPDGMRRLENEKEAVYKTESARAVLNKKNR